MTKISFSYKNIKKTKKLFLGILFFAGFSNAQANNACPPVDCDCASLPTASWKTACIKHERKLVAQCVKNGGTPLDYCSIQGPSARPVPAALKFKAAPVLFGQEISSYHKQVDTLIWSIGSDMNDFRGLINAGSFSEAQGIVNIIDRNLDTLFTKQRQVTISHSSGDNLKDAQNAWRKYSKKNLRKAEELFSLGRDLWERNKIAETASQSKSLRLLSMKILRMSSKTYEMAAYSYANANMSSKSAEVWRDAAETSKTIMEYKSLTNSPRSHVNYYAKQAAMRLFRASYHWQIDARPKQALAALSASREFVLEKELISKILRDYENSLDGKTLDAMVRQ